MLHNLLRRDIAIHLGTKEPRTPTPWLSPSVWRLEIGLSLNLVRNRSIVIYPVNASRGRTGRTKYAKTEYRELSPSPDGDDRPSVKILPATICSKKGFSLWLEVCYPQK